MTKERVQELEKHLEDLHRQNADLNLTLQDAQQAAVEKARDDATENLRLRKQVISMQRMLSMFANPPSVAPSTDEVEAPPDEPEPPKGNRKTRHAVRKDG